MQELLEGAIFEDILLETCSDEHKGVTRPRVRPVEALPSTLRVEFPRPLREKHPMGTRFRATVKVCQKRKRDGTPDGPPYLRADTGTIAVVVDYRPNSERYAVVKAGSVSGLAYEYVDGQSSTRGKTR